jgi:hypothetical protein
MQELYRKDLANHPGPEPCEGDRKVAREALGRGICRLSIELRNQPFRDAHGVGLPEGNTAAHDSASAQWSRGVEDLIRPESAPAADQPNRLAVAAPMAT